VNEHRWAQTGVWDSDGTMIVPCLNPSCDAALRVYRSGRRVLEPTGHGTTVHGIRLDLEDDTDGGVSKIICHEIAHDYDLASIPLLKGDVVLDIGAHIGVVSIYLALRFPGVRILAYEPVKENYQRLVRNIEVNGVALSVIPHNLAVTGNGRDVTLHGELNRNSGGSSLWATDGAVYTAHSVTLGDIFRTYALERVRLLKIDCEGAEWEILPAAGKLLERVDYLVGEFHSNSALDARGHRPPRLRAFCEQWIPAEHVRVTECRMGG